MAGQLKLVKVNVDESPTLSRRFDAQSIPTLVLLGDGKVIAKQVGALPAARLRSWLTNQLP
jgi:thioredoxin 2